MKILIGENIKAADVATMQKQQIDALELMESAAEMIAQWLCNNVEEGSGLLFLVGKGGNGGDGLAVARMMSNAGWRCRVKLLFEPQQLSEECRENLERLPEGVQLFDMMQALTIDDDDVVIDAMLGSGVVGAVKEPIAKVIDVMNGLPNRVVAIDLPSGMPTEFANTNDDELSIIQAETTLAIEFPKLSTLLPTYGDYAGNIVVLPIELDADFMDEVATQYYYITPELVDNFKSLVLPRTKFGHKNMFGHALLICGNRTMMGASVLATSAALRSGCGLVTTHIPADERSTMNASCPSAILSLDESDCFSVVPQIDGYKAIGIGCGVGCDERSVAALKMLLSRGVGDQTLVFDADAINMIAADATLRAIVPQGSILTPHLGELSRLCEWSSDEELVGAASQLAVELRSVVVVKGAHTMICAPDGEVFFNSTGCAGMAKGGAGDVLTGFITGLLARGYDSVAAAVVGVYLHGVAGQKAAAYYGEEGMNSSDIIDFLAEAMVEI